MSSESRVVRILLAGVLALGVGSVALLMALVQFDFRPALAALCGVLGAIGGAMLVFVGRRILHERKRRAPLTPPLPPPRLPEPLGLVVALDVRARGELERRLGASDPITLREVMDALLDVEDSWQRAGVVRESTPVALSKALRARLLEPTRDGSYRATAGAVKASSWTSSDPPSAVLAIAATPIADTDHVQTTADAGDLRTAFRALASTRSTTQVELSWTPANGSDSLGTAEIDERFPELVRIDPNTRPIRATCGRCGCRYPPLSAECPECGARNTSELGWP